MTIKVECPECDKRHLLPDTAAGKKFRCKQCEAVITVPTDDYADTDDDFEEEPVVRRRAPAKKSKGKKSKSSKSTSVWSTPLPWIAIGGGGFLAIGLLVVLMTGGSRPTNNFAPPTGTPVAVPVHSSAPMHGSPNPAPTAVDAGSPNSLFSVSQIPVPSFPELGAPRVLQPSGVRMWFVKLPPSSTPGQSMAFRVYLPPTDAPEHSIPCVLVAPAGSNLLVGNDMDADDYHKETLPYAEAGMAVIFYSLDGGLADMQNATDAQFKAAYNQFRTAFAGVVNGRNALEYALTKMPQVDPKKIYTAGHSSAGTVSLLMSEHEPRLAGAIAYAPCSDVEARLAQGTSDPTMQRILPNLLNFVKQSSPKTHVAKVGCPLFLFHAMDDSNVMVGESQNFVQLLKNAGKQVEFQTVPRGNHYQPMIDRGIPAAITWIKQQNAK